MSPEQYDPNSRLDAAVRFASANWACTMVAEMLQEEPELSGTQVLDRLTELATSARAERDHWDSLQAQSPRGGRR
jgi:hypothetical protein